MNYQFLTPTTKRREQRPLRAVRRPLTNQMSAPWRRLLVLGKHIDKARISTSSMVDTLLSDRR